MLLTAMEANVRHALGASTPGLRWAAALRPVLAGSQAVAVDGRMLAHEWLVTGRGLAKVDALDHHDDHFLPGCQDIAWDIAGACLELRLDRAAREHLPRRYLLLSGDETIGERLPVYRVAYAAARHAYADHAATALAGSADGARFRADAGRYRRALVRALAPVRSQPSPR
jgi:hypothetical protein